MKCQQTMSALPENIEDSRLFAGDVTLNRFNQRRGVEWHYDGNADAAKMKSNENNHVHRRPNTIPNWSITI